ncbi:MAG: Gfo/Idh/MocA family oxidoreductase [Frankiaceae bacterium]
MTDQQPLSVGLLGYGIAGEVFHAPLLAATPGLRLAAVVTGDPQRQRRARARHPGADVLPSADALWHRPGRLDVVVVATTNRTHVELALAALAAGSAVVVDKPLAPTAAEGRQLLAEAARLGGRLTVFQNRRWDGDFLTLRALAADGALGRVLRLESRFERWRPQVRPGWRELPDPAEAGGALADLGAHLIDQALQLSGPVTSVYAELDRRRPGAAVDDDAFVALTHASGSRSHLWMSAVAAQPGPRLRALGDRAAYVKEGLDGQEEALRSGASPAGPGWGTEPPERWGLLGAGERLERVPTIAGNYPRFYAELVAALRGDAALPVDPRDSVTVLELIEAARRSAASGGPVRP